MISKRIERARELLASIPHVAVATVNKDGTPHNSPVFMAFDGQLSGYWSSHPASLHSQNIARTGRVFMVVFDGHEGHGGLFIEATAEVLEDPAEVRQALAVLATRKQDSYGAMGDIDGYTGQGSQRLYRARPMRVWVNQSEKDAHGAIIRDNRHEIAIQQLL